MEELFRKVTSPSGRTKYVSVGFQMPDIQEGVWLVTKNKNVKEKLNLLHGIEDISKIDLKLYSTLSKNKSQLGTYIQRIQNSKSEEFKAIKKNLGSWVGEDIKIFNISPQDLSFLFIRELVRLLKEKEV